MKLLRYCTLLMPLILSLLFYRLFHVVDNRWVLLLGETALKIHNIQFQLVAAGQILGLALGSSSLIFWRRKNFFFSQKQILDNHLIVGVLISLLFVSVFVFIYETNAMLFPDPFKKIAGLYIMIGCTNFILQTLFSTIDAIFMGNGHYRFNLSTSFILLTFNSIFDYLSVRFLFTGDPLSPESVAPSLIAIGLSTTFMLTIAFFYGFRKLSLIAEGTSGFSLQQNKKVIIGELGTAIIRALAPILFVYLLSIADRSNGLYVSYNLALHLGYISALPLFAGIPMALRDASEMASRPNEVHFNLKGWGEHFLIASFFPTFILLLICSLFSDNLISWIYGYEIPNAHHAFVTLFFVACAIGQIGQIAAILLRSLKHNIIVARNFLLTEVAMQLGGTSLLILFNKSTPSNIGWIIIMFASTYTLLNFYKLYKESRSMQKEYSLCT